MKKLLAITLCFAFIGIRGVLAQTEIPKHSVDLGTEISYIKYEEPGLMKEEGTMYGAIGSYTYRGELFKLQKIMFKAEGKFAYGQLGYDGALQDGTPYTMKNINDYLVELRGLGGYSFSIFKTFTLTPYIGIGYRYLNDNSSSDPAGYERESNYIYSPVGLEITTALKNNWLIGATAEYDIFWHGLQKSHLDYIVENEQNKGYGLRGSLKIQKKGEKLDLIIEPYIRYWNIQNSKIVMGWIEPKNNSTEMGLKLAVKF